jgi:hypothetical protein
MGTGNANALTFISGFAGNTADCQSAFTTKDAATLLSFISGGSYGNSVSTAAITAAALGMTQPAYSGSIAGTADANYGFGGSVNMTVVDPTLTAGSAYASGADFSNPRLGIAARADLINFIEIGSSGGEGSTKYIISGLESKNDGLSSLHCMEISEPRMNLLKNTWQKNNFVHFYRYSTVSIREYPSNLEVANFYYSHKTSLNMYSLRVVLQWLRNDKKYLQQNASQLLNNQINGVPLNGIEMIKKTNNIEIFDFALIDGGEFTGFVELGYLLGTKVIALDDVNSFKCWEAYHFLLRSEKYHLVFEDWETRNGFAIFERETD